MREVKRPQTGLGLSQGFGLGLTQGFQTLRRALLEAPALALPNPNKPFQLFADEKQGIGKGVFFFFFFFVLKTF